MRSTAETRMTVPITRSAVLSAFAVGLALTIRVPILPTAPFLTYEPSDIPLLIGAFVLGPGWAAGIAVAVASTLGLVGGGGIIGVISRLVGSLALGVTAGLAYRHLSERRGGSLISVALGVMAYIAAEIVMTLLLGPLFTGSFRTAVAMILPVVIPFNLIKGVANGAASLIIWSLLAGSIRRSGGPR